MGGGGASLGKGKGYKGELNATTAGGKAAYNGYASAIKTQLDGMKAQGLLTKSGTGSRANVKRNLERRVVKLLSMQGKEAKDMHGDWRGLLKNKGNNKGRTSIVNKLTADYLGSNTSTNKAGKVGWKRGKRGGKRNQILSHDVHGYAGETFRQGFKADKGKKRSKKRIMPYVD